MVIAVHTQTTGAKLGLPTEKFIADAAYDAFKTAILNNVQILQKATSQNTPKPGGGKPPKPQSTEDLNRSNPINYS